MCAVTLETVYTVADVLPVMAVVKGFCCSQLVGASNTTSPFFGCPLVDFPLRICELGATSELCESNDAVES